MWYLDQLTWSSSSWFFYSSWYQRRGIWGIRIRECVLTTPSSVYSFWCSQMYFYCCGSGHKLDVTVAGGQQQICEPERWVGLIRTAHCILKWPPSVKTPLGISLLCFKKMVFLSASERSVTSDTSRSIFKAQPCKADFTTYCYIKKYGKLSM